MNIIQITWTAVIKYELVDTSGACTCLLVHCTHNSLTHTRHSNVYAAYKDDLSVAVTFWKLSDKCLRIILDITATKQLFFTDGGGCMDNVGVVWAM